MRYLRSILIGLPTWFVVGILISFSPEFAKSMNINTAIDPGIGIMISYSAIAIGDVIIGLLSQYFKSRKKAMHVFYAITMIGMLLFFTAKSSTPALSVHRCHGIWNWFLGCFCNDWRRKFWNQFESHGRHHYSKHGSWIFKWYYSIIPLVSRLSHLRQFRDSNCRSCYGNYVLGNLRAARNLWKRLGFH